MKLPHIAVRYAATAPLLVAVPSVGSGTGRLCFANRVGMVAHDGFGGTGAPYSTSPETSAAS